MTDLATSGATRRLEVLTGPERRRRYSASEKAELVAETLRPGACAARIARRHGLHPQQLYTWRRQARRGDLALCDEDLPMFAPVVAEAAPTTRSGCRERKRDRSRAWRAATVVRPRCAGRASGRDRGSAARRMILPSGPVRVYVATKPVDFRKGIDGLAALAEVELRLDPFSGVVLVFRAKRADRVS
jgi:transposase-like protein